MLTPQEVSSRSFTKAVMGGYNMTMVDEFLDQLTDDYTSLYKENASLKAKLKVLLEKVEEYRKTEDGMRSTLLAAQNLAAQITADAEKQRDEILRGAEQAAAEKIAGIEQEVADNASLRINDVVCFLWRNLQFVRQFRCSLAESLANVRCIHIVLFGLR